MKICLKCGNPCEGIPIVESAEDEPIELDVLSDCCFEDFEEVDDDYRDEVIFGWRYGNLSELDLSDLDRLVLRAKMYEV